MQNLNFLETELLDILFRGKNKNYGAYTLRKFYAQRLRNSLLIVAGLLLSIFIMQYALMGSTGGILDNSFVPTQDYTHDIKELILPKRDAGKAGELPPPVAKNNPQPKEIVSTAKVNSSLKKNKTQTDPQPLVTAAGKEGTNVPDVIGNGGVDPNGIGIANDGGSTGSVASSPKTVVIKELVIAEHMPEFPGGEEAMLRYLESHIDYPKIAVRNRVQGTVFVQFVVNTEGKISKLKILDGIGGGCDAEAKRVIHSMPKWNPGMQDGHKVNVSFIIPVKFEL